MSHPTTVQLRRYRIKEGRLDQFVAEWSQTVLPLRRSFSFAVVAAWTLPESSEFIWILEHPDFERADAAYYASSERTSASPDPARHIEHAFEAFAHRVI